MSDVYSFVGTLRFLQLPSVDTVFVVPIPDQTAVWHVLMVPPVETDQDLEEVDEFLVCSCCSLCYA